MRQGIRTPHGAIHLFLSLSCTLAFAACGEVSAPPDAAGQLQWYTSCGDPVCGGYQPTPGATVCTAEMEGAACSAPDTRCEIPDDGCNADLVCTDSDPKVNCPISQRRLKRDIRYLSSAQRDELTRQLLNTRLATYRYVHEPASEQPHLGFLIDDQPHSPAVLPRGDRVDLYGYTSMAVATLQAQAERIQRLEQQIARLEHALEALRRDRAAE